MDDFAAELTRQRRRSGLSLGRLATRAGLDKSAISRLEHGLRHPTRETIAALIEGLGLVDTDEDRQARVRLYLGAGFVPPGHRVTGLERMAA